MACLVAGFVFKFFIPLETPTVPGKIKSGDYSQSGNIELWHYYDFNTRWQRFIVNAQAC